MDCLVCFLYASFSKQGEAGSVFGVLLSKGAALGVVPQVPGCLGPALADLFYTDLPGFEPSTYMAFQQHHHTLSTEM